MRYERVSRIRYSRYIERVLIVSAYRDSRRVPTPPPTHRPLRGYDNVYYRLAVTVFIRLVTNHEYLVVVPGRVRTGRHTIR